MTSFYYPQIYYPPQLLSYPINQTNLLLFQFLGVGFSLFRTIVNFPFGSGRLLNKPTPYLHVQPSLSGFKTNNKRALIVILSTIILNSVIFFKFLLIGAFLAISNLGFKKWSPISVFLITTLTGCTLCHLRKSCIFPLLYMNTLKVMSTLFKAKKKMPLPL
jgi:hypothetical protein